MFHSKWFTLWMIAIFCLSNSATAKPPARPGALPEAADPRLTTLIALHQEGPRWVIQCDTEDARPGDPVHLQSSSEVFPVHDFYPSDALTRAVFQTDVKKVLKTTPVVLTGWMKGGKRLVFKFEIKPY